MWYDITYQLVMTQQLDGFSLEHLVHLDKSVNDVTLALGFFVRQH